jgi:predicted dehydrogenase
MYKVGVVGLGHIAHSYSKPEEKAPYSHIGGIRYSGKVELAAVADVSEAAREKFREIWGAYFPNVRYYDGFAAMVADGVPDIIAVCVRGPHHFATMMEVIKAKPRAVFLEKPPSCSLKEMDKMVAAARAKKIPITVSYSRHWCPHVLRLQELVGQGLIGKVTTVVGYCGGSFLSFASHTTDLICQFAGYCPTAVYARGTVSGEAPEGYEPEPSLSAMTIEFANGVTGIQVGESCEHGSFYVDVIGTEGLVRAGIYIPPFARTKKGEVIDLAKHGMPENASVFKVAYDQIADHLSGGPLPHCTNGDWVAVNEIGFAAIESVRRNQRIELPNKRRTRRIFANG